MTPSFSHRIDSMIQAMRDIILPSIDPHKSLEIEQAHLIVAHLQLIREQLPRAAEFDRLELEAAMHLGRNLLPLALGGPNIVAAANVLQAALKMTDQMDLPDATRRVNTALEALVRASRIDGQPREAKELSAEVFRYGLLQTQRDRIWFASNGFDAEKDTLPAVSTLFDG